MSTDDTNFKLFGSFDMIEKGGDRIVQGVCTTEDKDRQNEVLLADGLDFSQLLGDGSPGSAGKINDDHDDKEIIGFPLSVERFHRGNRLPDGSIAKSEGYWFRGQLYKGLPRADYWWNLGRAMIEQSGGRHRPAFSVQGKIVTRDRRNPKVVKKAYVNHMAMTASPVNPHAYAEAFAKAMTAGASISDPGASPGQGFPLRTEDLFGEVVEREYGKRKRRRKKRPGEIDIDEAVSYLVKKGFRTPASIVGALRLTAARTAASGMI